jgi:hypothetical protein
MYRNVQNITSTIRSVMHKALWSWNFEVRTIKLTNKVWNFTIPNRVLCIQVTCQASKQAVAYCWHSPAWLFLVLSPIGTQEHIFVLIYNH